LDEGSRPRVRFVDCRSSGAGLHRGRARRWKEYAAWIAFAGLGAVFGAANDLITSTLSRAYFEIGKGLRRHPSSAAGACSHRELGGERTVAKTSTSSRDEDRTGGGHRVPALPPIHVANELVTNGTGDLRREEGCEPNMQTNRTGVIVVA
jgi:hypothetical protein